jgi:hypothetical protein
MARRLGATRSRPASESPSTRKRSALAAGRGGVAARVVDLDIDAAVVIFEDDLQNSRRVTLNEWHERPWSDKVLDPLAALLSSQL